MEETLFMIKPDAVRAKKIGATDPKEAKPGTIRALHAESKQNNAVHASDSPGSARTEIQFFFGEGKPGR